MIDRQEVLRLFRETEYLGIEIAIEMGCHASRLVQIVRSETGLSPTQYRAQHGWVTAGTKGSRACPVPPRLVQMVLDCHSLRYQNNEITAATGIGPRMVAHILKLHDLKPNPWRSRFPGEEIAERYKAGETTLDLQDAYGVSERLIRRILDEQGVKRRPRFGRS